MTSTIVLWFFLAVINGKGLSGGAHTTEAECLEAREEVAANLDVMFISDKCEPITINRILPKPKEKA